MSKFLSKLKDISTKSKSSTGIEAGKPSFVHEDPALDRLEAQEPEIQHQERQHQEPEPESTPESSVAHQEQAPQEPEAAKTPGSSLLKKRLQAIRETPLVTKLATTLKPIGPIAKAAQKSLREKPLHQRRSFWIGLGLVGVGSGALAVGVGLHSLERSLPATSEILTFVRGKTLTIKAADGAILEQMGEATREKLQIEEIPPKLVEAFIAIEDRRFYKHEGVDFQGILRASVLNVLARDVVQGGSTITQQLARIVFLNQDPSAERKIREALLARKIEREMKKEQILERYLNLVYLGSGAYGVADAAWVYFGKQVDEMTLAEMATIAGLPPAPTEYSPLVNAKVAQDRRDIVLREMQEAGFITAAEADAAINSPLKLNPKIPKRLQIESAYFTTYIKQQLPRYVSTESIEMGGLTVETTLNRKWQKIAEKVVKDAIELDGPAQGFEQAALVSIDPRNGEIKALVGGNDFETSQFNRATQAQRQPGSTFKGFVYTAAIAAGFSPYDGYLDAPLSIDGYKPQNYGKTYRGWTSMMDALTSSINIVAVKVLADVGFEPTIKLARDMGIKTELKPYYALALGAIEVNLLELTNGYGTLAAQGNFMEAHGITKVTDGRGKVLYDGNLKQKRVVDKDSAALMTWMLERVVQNGTGAPAQLADRQVAGKTGTSEEARDLWFIGYIPQLVTGVWLGNDDSYPTWGTSGTAAFTWREFMSKAVEGMPVEEFPELPEIEGRKASIKAKPVNAEMITLPLPAPPPQPNSNTGYSNPDPGYNSGQYYDQGNSAPESSGNYYEQPASQDYYPPQ